MLGYKYRSGKGVTRGKPIGREEERGEQAWKVCYHIGLLIFYLSG